MADLSNKSRWLVRTHHAMRVSSFATVFVASCLHIAGKGYGPGTWAFLVLLLLIYPQLQYRFALRATQPTKAVMRALLVDSVLLGAFRYHWSMTRLGMPPDTVSAFTAAPPNSGSFGRAKRLRR